MREARLWRKSARWIASNDGMWDSWRGNDPRQARYNAHYDAGMTELPDATDDGSYRVIFCLLMALECEDEVTP